MNLDHPQYSTTLSWVTDHPIYDPINNLVIGTHHYRSSGSLGFWDNGAVAWTQTDIMQAFTNELLLHVLYDLNKPVLVGEIGMYVDQSGQGLIDEANGFTNQLAIYKQLGLGYCAFVWANWSPFKLFTNSANPSGTLTQGGVILRDALLSQWN